MNTLKINGYCRLPQEEDERSQQFLMQKPLLFMDFFRPLSDCGPLPFPRFATRKFGPYYTSPIFSYVFNIGVYKRHAKVKKHCVCQRGGRTQIEGKKSSGAEN